MSVLVERSMGDLNKEGIPIFPMFKKGASAQPPPPKKRNAQADSKTSDPQPQSANTSNAKPRRTSKQSKAPAIDLTQAPAATGPSAEDTKAHGELLEVDPNNSRRKRRKTSSTERGTFKEGPALLPPGKTRVEEPVPAKASDDDHRVIVPESSVIIPKVIVGTKRGEAINNIADDPSDNKPRKVLRLNPKTGTIGSPPAKKSEPPPAKNEKKSTASRRKSPKSRVVTIRYGEGQPLHSTIGHKIDQILNKTEPAVLFEKMEAPNIVDAVPSKPAKSTHPFFLGKAAAAKITSPQKPTKRRPSVTDLTAQKERTPQATPPSRGKQSTQSKAPIPFSGFGASTKIVKFPGAVEPAWPWRGMVHVRGPDPLDQLEDSQQVPSSALSSPSQSKKSKYQAIRILQGEDILGILAEDLRIPNVLTSIRDVDPNEFPPIADCLRVPTKHLEPGFDIQRRVRKEVFARLPPPNSTAHSSSEDEIQQSDDLCTRLHPAILNIYGSISTSISAFDKGQREPQPWPHKYSPKSSSNVLQTGKEASILKEWLQSLTVKSVEAGLGASSRRSGAKSEPNGKRKRKSKKLDGFVISSDEGDDDMDEISEPEDGPSPFGSQGPQTKTVVRTGTNKDSGRLNNAVVISGPHGCGKTAAVYAVAKELGFEVFEIHPGAKRSGKEILDKVGDMAQNHQVQRLPALPQLDGPADEDRRRIDEALANDLKSGRQGTMNSFFKSQPAAKPKAKPKAPAPVSTKGSTKQAQLGKEDMKPKPPAKAQKQSLILIEEADILYKEDSHFWPTILNLATTSKRPIIITCNDESVIPTQALPLHAIIRMSPPPVDLATDYILLVAACEGHVLKREAVQAVYESRNMDLRAALTELNFWCQFAVGDEKNGLGWYLSRWPKGNDVDKDGNTIRVVSEGTYKVGMGWLSQDVLESNMHHLDIEEETLHEMCDGWGLDIGDWQKTLDLDSWAQNDDRTQSRAALRAYDDFLETMSDADCCSGGLFAPDNQLIIDPSIPELADKVRLDYTLDSDILEASALVNYDTLSKDITLWMRSRSRNYLHVDQHVKMDREVPPELSRPDESDIIRLIRKGATYTDPSLTRRNFSVAFDPISEPEKTLFTDGKLDASVFDRTMKIIVEDMAPYVRSIVDFDARLQEERIRRSNLLSEGGRKGKKMRMTRAAMSALEGGARSTTRREKYFGSLLNPHLVMKTGMQTWMDAALVEVNASGSRRSSKGSLEESKTESERDELMDV
ncbi:related to ELG1 Protein required for S phase progression and telomere homeostasis, forms an alternative replication factor C complex important for DNA replication and genome integrity [Phialocephala subalpina]|uniref:Related to ELG1 Protein required for S phase progression and telomere homeostasis, forms an alternative replication factor C complex important for DNA replication and genome integrity n=1 Tax=Phialocephala subalpina TaxID=576137 RepID=A0A1L7WVY7_9HELO|nr:related to ELG1 Protein required for S phase progression and telomere homeostasis, forms an alternative replication factor C complex important for DNA replication and genome integrity [Phialocephala subalpina]